MNGPLIDDPLVELERVIDEQEAEVQRLRTALATIAKCPSDQLDPSRYALYVLDRRSAEELQACFHALRTERDEPVAVTPLAEGAASASGVVHPVVAADTHDDEGMTEVDQ